MMFTGLTIPWLLTIGLSAVAALVLLQMLLQRPPQRRVVTILFWPSALSSPPATVLWDRFQRWGSFLLLLLIVLLLTAALAGPRWAQKGAPVAIVVDAGAQPGASGDQTVLSDTCRDRVKQLAASVAQDQPFAVIVANPEPRVALAFDQERATLERILEKTTYAQSPANTLRALRQAYQLVSHDPRGRLVLVTSRTKAPHDVGEDVLKRLAIYAADDAESVARVSAIVYVPDESHQNRGHVLVRINPGASRDITVRVSHESGDLAVRPLAAAELDVLEFTTPAIPANGNLLRVSVMNQAGKAIGQPVSWRVPQRESVLVQIDPDVPAAVRAAVLASGAVESRAATGVIRVCTNAHVPADAPAIVIVQGGNSRIVAGARLVNADASAPLAKGLNFETARCGTGPEVADGIPLFKADGAAVVALAKESSQQQLYISAAMLGSESDVSRRIAFPMLIARALETFAGKRQDSLAISSDRYFQDPTLFDLVLDGQETVLSAEPDDTAHAMKTDPQTMPAAPAMQAPQPLIWLLGGALALMVVEAILYMKRRIA